jgi:hypothetical protein
MTPTSYSVSDIDVTALRDNYSDGIYGDTLARHLCARGGEGLAEIQLSTCFSAGKEERRVVMAKVAISGAGNDGLSADPSSAVRHGPTRNRSDNTTKSVSALRI